MRTEHAEEKLHKLFVQCSALMQSIGEFAYLLTLRATENTIKGGFVGGGGGKVRPPPFSQFPFADGLT